MREKIQIPVAGNYLYIKCNKDVKIFYKGREGEGATLLGGAFYVIGRATLEKAIGRYGYSIDLEKDSEDTAFRYVWTEEQYTTTATLGGVGGGGSSDVVEIANADISSIETRLQTKQFELAPAFIGNANVYAPITLNNGVYISTNKVNTKFFTGELKVELLGGSTVDSATVDVVVEHILSEGASPSTPIFTELKDVAATVAGGVLTCPLAGVNQVTSIHKLVIKA